MQSEYDATLGGLLIDNLAYADDNDTLANSRQELQAQTNKLQYHKVIWDEYQCQQDQSHGNYGT